MAIKNKLIVTAFLISFLVMGITQTTQAYTFYIDEFSVTKNGSPLFDDKFNDGTPPPSAPASSTLLYINNPSVLGTVGPENTALHPDKLTLDSSGAVPFTFVDTTPFIHQQVILGTNIDSTNTTLGLKRTDTFSVTGVFDLIAPSGLREGYDVMFNDGTQTPLNIANDIAMVRVVRNPSNVLQIQLAHIDFVLGLNQVINFDSLDLDSNHLQIALTLEKKLTDSNAITGSYYYIDSGGPGPIHTFANTIEIFHPDPNAPPETTENFTRAEFEAFAPAPVPEPGTMLLLGSGLVGLAGFARKKLKK